MLLDPSFEGALSSRTDAGFQKPKPPPVNREGMRVLVVDDDTDTADSFGLLLHLWGYDTRVCYRAWTALRIAEAYRPDVVLLDVAMPGMDGYELARRLRDRKVGSSALLIAVTGYTTPAHRRLAKAAGCDFHFAKPVEPSELHRVLQCLSARKARWEASV